MIEGAIIIVSAIAKFSLNNDFFLNQYFQLEPIKRLKLHTTEEVIFIKLDLIEVRHCSQISYHLNKPLSILQSFKEYCFYPKNC